MRFSGTSHAVPNLGGVQMLSRGHGETESERRPAIKVYLAEDDPALRSTLALLLRKDGHHVVEAGDGVDLLTDLTWEQVHGKYPEEVVVVSDVRMPKTDGLAIMRSLRLRGRLPRFILMTAFPNAELRAEAESLGVLALFEKPFDFDELRELIRRVGPPQVVTPDKRRTGASPLR